MMPEPPVPKLTLYFDNDFGDSAWANLTFALHAPEKVRGEWVLGRSPACDLTIKIREVSARHCVITYSYARDAWTLTDLGSTNGTYHKGRRLLPGEGVALQLRDKISLAANARIQVVEDEEDTISPDYEGPSTVASTTPLDYRPQGVAVAPAPAPEPVSSSKTPWDSVYLGTQWLLSGSTTAGKIYRLVMAALAVVGLIFMMNWLTQ